MTSEERLQRIQATCLIALTAFAIAFALYWLSALMIPFVLAILLVFALNPLVHLLTTRARIPRTLSVLVIFLIGFLLFPVFGAVLSASVSQLSTNSGAYQQQITHLITQGIDWIEIDRLGINRESVRAQLSSMPIGSLLVGITNTLLQILSNAVLVLILAAFLLVGGGQSVESPLWGQIRERIEGYLVAQIALSTATGVLVSLILYVLGVELALLFGFLAFLLNFIPTIGSIVATFLPLPLILLSPDGGPGKMVLALSLMGVVQLAIGNFIAPRVLGRSLELHPVAVILALLFWGVLWGIAGMFLAVPITAVLRILLEQSDLTRPVADLMAGRP
ncbi:MAG: AI-2E family transporter [Myxococcota bacterium]